MRPARSPLGPGLSSQWGGLRATPLLAARAATPPPGPPCPCGGVVVHSPIGSFTPPGLWPVACPPPGFPPGPAGWAAPGRVAWSSALPLLRLPSWPCSAWLPPLGSRLRRSRPGGPPAAVGLRLPWAAFAAGGRRASLFPLLRTGCDLGWALGRRNPDHHGPVFTGP